MSLLDSLLGGYVNAQQSGQPQPAPSRRTLVFQGASVIDNGPTANSTTVLISGGGGAFPGGDLCSGTGTTVNVGSGLTLAGGTLSASGVSSGPYSSRPSPSAGSIYGSTDGIVAQWVSNGSAWRPVLGAIPTLGTQPPAASTFTRVGASTATLTDIQGSLELTANDVSNAVVFYGSNVVTSGGFSLEACLSSTWRYGGVTGSEALTAIVIYETSSGHMVRWAIAGLSSGSFVWGVQQFSSPNAVGSVVYGYSAPQVNVYAPVWLAIRETGATRTYEYSYDGQHWIVAYSEAVGTYITTDRVGVYNSWSGSIVQKQQILSYSVT
jgi:hypothetical protein